MKIELKEITIKEVSDGYKNSDEDISANQDVPLMA